MNFYRYGNPIFLGSARQERSLHEGRGLNSAELLREPSDQTSAGTGLEQVDGMRADHRPAGIPRPIEPPVVAQVLRAARAMLFSVVLEDDPPLDADQVETADDARAVADFDLELEVPSQSVRFEQQPEQRRSAPDGRATPSAPPPADSSAPSAARRLPDPAPAGHWPRGCPDAPDRCRSASWRCG